MPSDEFHVTDAPRLAKETGEAKPCGLDPQGLESSWRSRNRVEIPCRPVARGPHGVTLSVCRVGTPRVLVVEDCHETADEHPAPSSTTSLWEEKLNLGPRRLSLLYRERSPTRVAIRPAQTTMTSTMISVNVDRSDPFAYTTKSQRRSVGPLPMGRPDQASAFLW